VDRNRYRSAYPGQLHREYKIQHREELYVYRHIQLAHRQFGNVDLQQYYGVAQVTYHAAMASAQDSALQSVLETAVESAVCVSWAMMKV